MKITPTNQNAFDYIKIPCKKSSTVKIDTVVEQRMKEFLLSRRRMRWLELGE